MPDPIAHLPMSVEMNVLYDDRRHQVAEVTVAIPFTVTSHVPDKIHLALDTPEMKAALRRAVNAFDEAFHTKES